MWRRYFVVSDVEMGKKDIMDDFSDDEHFVEFVECAGRQEEPVTLILNGDIFDFLKMDFQGEYPRYITEDISLWKLERVLESHPKVFEALALFLQPAKNKLFFVIGNHDFDLVWPTLQQRLRDFLGSKGQVEFDFSFDQGDLHIQHGHLVDPFFAHEYKNEKDLFLDYRGQRILNLPVGSHVVFAYLTPFKKKFPREEQLYPRSKLIDHHPDYYREINKIKWLYILKIALNRMVHFWNPTYRINLKAFLKHVREFGFDFFDDERFLPSRLRDLYEKHPQKKLFVLGHTHIFAEMEYKGKRFLLTDTWRDEFSLIGEGFPKKKKSFVEILVHGDEVREAGIKVFSPKNVN